VLQPRELCEWVLDALGETRGDAPEVTLARVAANRQREGGLLLLIDDATVMPDATSLALPALRRASQGNLRWVLTRFWGAASVGVVEKAGAAQVVRLDAPLTLDEAAELLRAALDRSGSSPQLRARFDSSTVQQLHQQSRGVPARLLVEARRLLYAGARESIGSEPPAQETQPSPAQTSVIGSEPPTGPPVRPEERPRADWVRLARICTGSAFAAGLVVALAVVSLRDTPREDPPHVSAPPPKGSAAQGDSSSGEAAAPPAPMPQPAEATQETTAHRLQLEEDALTIASPPNAAPAGNAPAQGTPALAEAPSPIPPTPLTEPETTTYADVIEPGEWLAASLREKGIPPQITALIAREVGDRFDFRFSRAGHSYRIVLTRSGELIEFEYVISATDRIHLNLEDDRYIVKRFQQ
jgi:hypothetical protein